MLDHSLINYARRIPLPSSTAATTSSIISIAPITLQVPSRPVDLQLRLTFPYTIISSSTTTATATGIGQLDVPLPILLLSHGHGPSNNLSSLNGYAPLAQFYASHGFIVIQPTHLSSRTLSFDESTTTGAPLFWRERAQDMSFILDQIGEIEELVPLLNGRFDTQRVGVVGHSMGGHTAAMLLGMTVKDPDTGEVVSLGDKRIKAGVLLASPGSGNGGNDLSAFCNEHYRFFRSEDFGQMRTQTLVVAGDEDLGPHLTVRGVDWHEDAYWKGGGEGDLLRLRGGKHGLGGVSGYDTKEAADEENVDMVEVVRRVTLGWLRRELSDDVDAWNDVQGALKDLPEVGTVLSKR